MYNRFSDYLFKKYGAKTYKLPINIAGTCPNKDGTVGNAGCIFCGEESAGFEALPSQTTIKAQIEFGAQLMRRKYGARKFIAYFQNWSGTYRPLADLERIVREACEAGRVLASEKTPQPSGASAPSGTEVPEYEVKIVAIYIATRPDCLDDECLELLTRLKEEYCVDIVLEIGLQTVNAAALKFLNRGHSVAQFEDAVARVHAHGLEVCAHMILGLPMDTMADIIEGARLLSRLGVEQVKCHSLFVLEGTRLGELYKAGEIQMITKDEFIARTLEFLKHLSPEIAVQRLLGRAPEGKALFCNWDTSWWKIRDEIDEKIVRNMP